MVCRSGLVAEVEPVDGEVHQHTEPTQYTVPCMYSRSGTSGKKVGNRSGIFFSRE